jgi:hypothetical protein
VEPAVAPAPSPAEKGSPAERPSAGDATVRPEEIPAAFSLADLGFLPIGEVTVDTAWQPDPAVAEELQQPEDEAAPIFLAQGEVVEIPRAGDVGLYEGFFLEPATFCHQPLYFEEVNLERYGSSRCRLLQPLFSAYRFFFTVPALPYMLALERPRKCYYDHSPYLPGRPAPWHDESLPVRAGPAMTQGAAIAALIFIFPP